MKKTIVALSTLLTAAFAFGQGQVNFNNRVTVSPLGTVNAPIYGPQVDNPLESLRGNDENYTGARLDGAAYTAELWAAPAGSSEDQLVFVAATDFRTGNAAGYLNATTVTVPNVAGGAEAVFQVRAYDNMGGTLTSWAEVVGRTDVAQGTSAMFSPGFPLGGGTVQPPNLASLESFNLYIVPEPSTIALGVLGVGALILFRRRRS